MMRDGGVNMALSVVRWRRTGSYWELGFIFRKIFLFGRLRADTHLLSLRPPDD